MRRLLLPLAVLCAAPAFAQDAAVTLPPVDVPVPEADDGSPASVTRTSPSGVVTVIDAAARRGEAKDTAELLATAPGTVMSDAGGVGQRKSLSLRGVGSSGVLVLLDGAPLSAPGTSVDLSRIPAAILDRLEVLRGAASARYGPGALGGVVNLVTRRPTRGASLTAEATWGNFGTALASASASGALWGGDGLVLAHGARSTGDFGFLFDEQPTLPGGVTPRTRSNNEASGAGGLLRYRAALNPRWSVEVLGEGGAGSRRLAGTAQNPSPNAAQDAVHGLVSGRLTRTFEGGGEVSALGWGRLEDSTLYASPFHAGPWRQTEGGAGLDLAWSQLLFSRHGLSAAAHLTTEWLRNPGAVQPSWVRAGAMIGDEVFLFDGVLAVNATVRVDQSGPFTGVSPRAGALLLLPAGFEVRVNVGQAHRPPTFLELYVLQGHLAPNPDLRPERGVSADAAVGFRHENAFVQLGGFGGMYEDLISYEYYPPLLARPYNFQAAAVMGLEAEAAVQPARWLKASASYTLLSTQNLKDDPRYYLKALPYRPRHKLHAGASVGLKWLRARGDVLWQSEQFTNRTETVALEARAFINAGLVLQPWSGRTTVALALELKNLLDVHSQDLDGYPLPSRGAYLTLSVAWDDSATAVPVVASLGTSP